MRRIVFFTTNENWVNPDLGEGIVLYYFYVKLYTEIDKIVTLLHIDDYIVDLSVEEMMDRLCI